jgi:hypothetical protein
MCSSICRLAAHLAEAVLATRTQAGVLAFGADADMRTAFEKHGIRYLTFTRSRFAGYGTTARNADFFVKHFLMRSGGHTG